jgi:hypothetical protein
MKVFTPRERESLMVEVLMAERPEINSVMDLYNFLNREKGRIWNIMLQGDLLDRMKLMPELDEINRELADIELHYFNPIILKQDN